jgi:tetratricopeptide (TPR) repeat protein
MRSGWSHIRRGRLGGRSAIRPHGAPENAPDSPEALVFRAVGHGAFVGACAAALSHWAWGLNLLIIPFFYGFGMSRLRSWPELAAILSMLGTTVAYFCIYDVIAADSLGLWLTAALSVLVVMLLLLYQFMVGARVDAARVGALLRAQSLAEDVERSQQWEEKYFARLRAKVGTARGAWPWFRWWLVRMALAFGVAVLVFIRGDSRGLASLAIAVTIYHLIVWQRAVRYHRRLVQPGAELVVGRSTRRPILFLRPFALDGLPVAPMDSRWSLLKVTSWFDKRSFEEYLSHTFEQIGPVIAIGRPGEVVAALGAAREYADDASWRDLVLNRARVAQLVIMEVDASPGMEWELDQVPKVIGLQRLLILLPPGDDLFETRSPAWYDRWSALQSRHAFLPDVSKETAAVMFDDADHPVAVRTRSSVTATIDEVVAAWRRTKGSWSSASAWVPEESTSPTEPGPRKERSGTALDLRERRERRRLEYAEAALRGLVARRSLLHGRDDPEALRLRQELANVLRAKGELHRAQRLLEEVVTRRSQSEGFDGPLTLSALGDLANTQRLLGDLVAFRATAERVVKGSVHVFGDDHAVTFAARTKLGLALQDQGELRSARALLEKSLSGVAAGSAPPAERRMAQRLLASVLSASGDFEGARTLLTQVLEESREALGDEHAEVYETTAVLAEAHAGLEDHDVAAQVARKALAGSEYTFGREHPTTLKYLVNAARLSADAGDVDEAQSLAERAVNTTRTTLGAEHPDTLTALSVLGRVRSIRGEYEPALALFQIVWKDRRRVLGDRHPHTLAALASAAAMQLETGRTEEGLRNLQEAARGYIEALGPDHAYTQAVQALLERSREET